MSVFTGGLSLPITTSRRNDEYGWRPLLLHYQLHPARGNSCDPALTPLDSKRASSSVSSHFGRRAAADRLLIGQSSPRDAKVRFLLDAAHPSAADTISY